ncbi:hypothetical protein HDU97_007291 [Phlyctochytrium planicorne]|nr:hypothetical protein HDU97_007291 [Phlyctochytrium planicorne]
MSNEDTLEAAEAAAEAIKLIRIPNDEAFYPPEQAGDVPPPPPILSIESGPELHNGHLAFNFIYSARPWDLSFDLAEALLAQGALLPKFFVEKIYAAEQRRAVDESEGWQLLSPPIPQGTLEFLIAQGYKLYGDVLNLNLPSEATVAVSSVIERISTSSSRASFDRGQAPPLASPSAEQQHQMNMKDDAWLFEKSLSSPVPNIKLLKRILYDHHFTPALNPPATVREWDDLWGRVLNLLRADGSMGKFVFDHTGRSAGQANDGLMARALRDPKTKENFLKWLMANGFKISEGAVVQVLASPDVLQLDSIAGMSALDLLRSSVDEALLGQYAESALGALFREGGRESLRAADAILLEFELSEEAVTRAFLASPDELALATSGAAEGQLPFMTSLGRARGGMTDMMWQLILARHGARHPFASACLVDLVIGGTIKNPISVRKHRTVAASPNAPASTKLPGEEDLRKKAARAAATASAAQGDSSMGLSAADLDDTGRVPPPPPPGAVPPPPPSNFVDDTPVRQSFSIEGEDDRDLDAATRDSIEAMVEGAGVLIEPSLFGPISRSVLVSKKSRARVVDFMSRVEKGLLYASLDPNASAFDRQRWSKVRWVAAIRRHVLDDRQWLQQMVSPEELQAIEERRRRERGPPKRTSGIFSASPSSANIQSSPVSPTSPTSSSFAFKNLAAAGVGGIAGFGKAIGGMVRTRARGMAAAAAAAAAAHSGTGGKGVSAFFGSMVVDLVDRDWAEVRRFYTCCELLVQTLESSPSTGTQEWERNGSHATSVFADPENGPFTRWLRDMDSRQRLATHPHTPPTKGSSLGSGEVSPPLSAANRWF